MVKKYPIPFKLFINISNIPTAPPPAAPHLPTTGARSPSPFNISIFDCWIKLSCLGSALLFGQNFAKWLICFQVGQNFRCFLSSLNKLPDFYPNFQHVAKNIEQILDFYFYLFFKFFFITKFG
jgi:hypothetical protein